MKRLNALFLFVASLAPTAAALAQNENTKPTAEFFRLDFSVKETESGKLVSSRNYQMMVTTDPSFSSIRSGAKVPVSSGDKSFTYVDVGVNIDVRHIHHMNDGLSIDISAEVSGAVESPDSSQHQSGPPVIRQSRLSSTVLAQLRKPTVLFTTDDPATKRQTQLDVTVTPVR